MSRTVGLIMAMEAEAAPLIQQTGMKSVASPDPRLPFRYYRSEYKGLRLILSLSGKDARRGVDNIGTEPATLNTYLLIREFQPDLIVNAGTAGGFKKHGGEIGDIYFSSGSFQYHDHRIPIPGFDEYGKGSYPTLDVSGIAARLGYKTGVVSTGNALDFTDSCTRIMIENDARVKEMEAAAIAWVCDALKIPFFAVKSVTDIVDGPHPTAEEFLRNLNLASQNLSHALIRTLDEIASNPFIGA